MIRLRALAGIPFMLVALVCLWIAQQFNHVGELVGGEPCACKAFDSEPGR